jgi:hypothetical protein
MTSGTSIVFATLGELDTLVDAVAGLFRDHEAGVVGRVVAVGDGVAVDLGRDTLDELVYCLAAGFKFLEDSLYGVFVHRLTLGGHGGDKAKAGKDGDQAGTHIEEYCSRTSVGSVKEGVGKDRRVEVTVVEVTGVLSLCVI